MTIPNITILQTLRPLAATGTASVVGGDTSTGGSVGSGRSNGTSGTDFLGGADRAAGLQGPGWHNATRPATTREDSA